MVAALGAATLTVVAAILLLAAAYLLTTGSVLDKYPADSSLRAQNFNRQNYSAAEEAGLARDQDVKVISTKYYSQLISKAANTTRKRRMVDVTKNPQSNSMQTLINTWYDFFAKMSCLPNVTIIVFE